MTLETCRETLVTKSKVPNMLWPILPKWRLQILKSGLSKSLKQTTKSSLNNLTHKELSSMRKRMLRNSMYFKSKPLRIWSGSLKTMRKSSEKLTIESKIWKKILKLQSLMWNQPKKNWIQLLHNRLQSLRREQSRRQRLKKLKNWSMLDLNT